MYSDSQTRVNGMKNQINHREVLAVRSTESPLDPVQLWSHFLCSFISSETPSLSFPPSAEVTHGSLLWACSEREREVGSARTVSSSSFFLFSLFSLFWLMQRSALSSNRGRPSSRKLKHQTVAAGVFDLSLTWCWTPVDLLIFSGHCS